WSSDVCSSDLKALTSIEVINRIGIALRENIAFDLQRWGQLIFFLGQIRFQDIEFLDSLGVRDRRVDIIDRVLNLRAQLRFCRQFLDIVNFWNIVRDLPTL